MGSPRSKTRSTSPIPHPNAPEVDMQNFQAPKLGKGKDAWSFVPCNKTHDRFGFQRGGQFYGKVATTREDWTAFFAKVLRHELTRHLARHQHNPHLVNVPKARDRTMVRAQVETLRGVFGPQLPEEARRIVDFNRVIEVGPFIMHASDRGFDTDDKEHYRMKDTSDPRVMEMSWEVICELAAWWLRDVWVENNQPWASMPWLVTRPNPSDCFITNLLEPSQPQSLEPVREALEGDGGTSTVASEELDPRAVLLACAQRILDVGQPLVNANDPLGVALMTGMPVLGLVRDQLQGHVEPAELGSRAGSGLELPPDADLDTIIGVLSRSYPAVAAEIVDRAQDLETRSRELGKRERAVDRQAEIADDVAAKSRQREEQLRELRQSLASEVGRFFDAERDELTAQRAQIRAEATALDEARAEFGPALEELDRRRRGLAEKEAELALIREIEDEVAEREKALNALKDSLDQREQSLQERDDELARRAFELEQRLAQIERAEAAAGRRSLESAAGGRKPKAVKPLSKSAKKRRGNT